jgi:hypothetical protein
MHSTCSHFVHCVHCMVSSAAEYSFPDSPHPSQSTSLGENSGNIGVDGAKVDNAAVDPGDGCDVVTLACGGDRDNGADGVAMGLEDDCKIATPSADGANTDDVAMGSGDCCEIVTLACGGDKDGEADGAVKGLGDEADGAAMGLENDCEIATPSANDASPDDVAVDSGDGCEIVMQACGGDRDGEADGVAMGL